MMTKRFELILLFVVLAVLAGNLIGCGAARTYTVQAGDTLQGIAASNHVSVTDIIELNRSRYPSLATSPRSLQPGWVLDVPAADDVAIEIESLLMQLARQANPPGTPAPSVPAAPNQKIEEIVQRIYIGINQERARYGLAPLVRDGTLDEIALDRSNDMITRSYFSHTDPQSGQVMFQVLLHDRHYSYLFAGENIAEIRNQGTFVPAGLTVYARYGADDLGDQFVTGWINSPEHHDNIVNPHFRRTGIAVGVAVDGTRVVATQVFSD